MAAEPQPEHRWLEKLVGRWAYESTMQIGPDTPPETFSGEETVRSLGGLWILAEAEGAMPGGGIATMVQTIGYDPLRKRFVGTWVGSMMTYLWVYEGELAADGRTLTLDTEGPEMANPEKLAKFRDVIGITSTDERTLTSHILGADGSWQEIMKITYRRIT
jgi:hypothetical protein